MKKIRIRSAYPLYMAAGVWVLIGLIYPAGMLKLWSILLVAALSAGAYLLGEKLFPAREEEIREPISTGDSVIDEQIREGREKIERLKAHNDAIPDETITAYLKRVTDAGSAIFDAVEKEPAKAAQVRRFMSYYLPTTEKLMANYRALADAPSRGENMTGAMRSTENSLGMIADAFEKQLDGLYQDKAFDMESDVKVLETLLAGDGLTGSVGNIRETMQEVKENTINLTAQAGK